ncbi:MAG: Ig-like domain-containing protein, partial [Pseudomonadota bacterium]
SLAGLEDATIEIWGLSNAPRAWSRVFDFGTSTSNYLFVSWSRFADPSQTRVEWMKDGVPLFTADNEIGPFPLGVEQQVVVTINQIGENESTVCWYQNGGLEGCRTIAATLADITPTQPGVAFNALGRSKYEADETATAVYNEARIWDGALSANGVNATFLNGPVGGGVDIDISVVPATSVAVGTTTQMRATVTSTGGPITQDVDWQVTPQTVARIDSGGLLTGTQAGEVTVTATLRNRPTSAGSVTVSVQPAANPTAGFRVTAADLIGDLNKLPRSYQVRSWDGMDWPSAASSRGNDGHLQGVARVGETWVLTHSRGSFDGVIIWGENNAWQFDAARADLGRHPGGIQASADVIAVTYKDQANGIKFYRFDPDDPSAAFEELSHLRISSARGEAVGLAWHPDHGRYYLLDAGTFDNAVTSNKFCRTTKLGAPLSDPQNRWECGAQATSVFASSSGTQLMFDEDTRNLYAIALYRPGEDIPTEDLVDMVEDVVTDPDNMISFHQIQVTRLDFGSYDPSGPFADVRGFDAGGRGDFFPQPGLYIHQPSFRWASGVLLDESGHVSLIAVERCTSFESEFPGDSNQLPCEFFQDEVDYFIIE